MALGHSKKPHIIRRNHLLVIGIDTYSNGIPALNNAVRDAKEVAKVLQDYYQFEEKNTLYLFNEKATKDGIFDAFDYFLKKLSEYDNLIVYFSGHGMLNKRTNRGYWLPVDAKQNSRASYLSNQEIIDFFHHLKAHHILGIIDSCFSGTLFRKVETATERLRGISSRWLLTAGREEVVLDGSLGGHSPFAKALIGHLKNNPDNELWVADLCSRVLKVFNYNSEKQTPRGEPLHNVGHQGGQFIFYKKDYVPTEEDVEKESTASEITKGIADSSEKGTNTEQEKRLFTTLADLKKYLKELLQEAATEKLFSVLRAKIAETSRKSGSLSIQQGRYNRAMRDKNLGVVDPRDLNITFNRINVALDYLIDDLDEEDLESDALSKAVPPSTISDDFLTNIQHLENESLKKQVKLLISKRDRIEQALNAAVDPSVKFKYEQDIKEINEKLRDIKERLQKE